MAGDKVSVLGALADEVTTLTAELAPLGEALTNGDEEAAAQYLGLLERLNQVAEMLDMPALGELIMHLLGNIPAQLGDEQQRDLATGWPRYFEAFLRAPDDVAAQATLTACLIDDRWPEPMAAEQAEGLIEQLLASDEAMGKQTREPRHFDDADAELQLQADLTVEMRAAFEHETPRFAAIMNEQLAMLGQSGDIMPLLHQARRAAHTLKGSAALVGARAVVNLTHLLEEVLGQLQEQPERLTPALVSLLQTAGDSVEEMVESLLDQSERPSGILDLIQRMDSWAVQLDQPASLDAATDNFATDNLVVQPAPVNEALNEVDSEPADTNRAISSEAGASSGQTDEKVEVAAAATLEATEASLNVPVRAIDEMLRAVGELLVQSGHLQTRLRDGVERSSHLENHLFTMQQTVHELETVVDLRGTPAVQGATGQVAVGQSDLAGVGFDPLELDQYNQLHSLSRSFAESALDAREMTRELRERMQGMQNLMLQQQRLGREVNNSVMSARMIRVNTMSGRWQRIVRQTCRATGKQAELHLDGAELAVDTDILNGLVEPLLHLLRNAIDHGLERPEERLAAGKPGLGQIRLRFRQDGRRILVNLSDDGRGFDYEAITRRARALGLFADNHEPSKSELQQVVFAPGFSTRAQVTEVSGRGIGLDAVRAAVQRLGGTLEAVSEPGKGLRMQMILPQSLSSSHLLFVRVSDAMYALPSLGIGQILFSDSGVIEQTSGHWNFRFGQLSCQLYSLADMLNVEGEANIEQLDPPRPLVLMQTDEGQVALLVDQVVDTRDAVVKNLQTLFPNLSGVSGTCILADGGLAMVLDLNELRREIAPAATKAVVRRLRRQAPAVQLPRVMVVDDSLSARRSLSRLMQDMGYEVQTALDGIEAVEHMEQDRPDVILADLEMPRMNGLELTAHIRSRDEFQSIPVIMITSRSTEKHRHQAERVGVNHYITKPYQEEDLAELVRQQLAERRMGAVN